MLLSSIMSTIASYLTGVNYIGNISSVSELDSLSVGTTRITAGRHTKFELLDVLSGDYWPIDDSVSDAAGIRFAPNVIPAGTDEQATYDRLVADLVAKQSEHEKRQSTRRTAEPDTGTRKLSGHVTSCPREEA